MKRKIISIILVILLLQYYCGFVFAENTNDINQTSNETTNVEANNQISEELSKQQAEVKEKLNVKVLAMTAMSEVTFLKQAKEGNLDGLIYKNVSIEELFEAIDRVLNGDKVFSDIVYNKNNEDFNKLTKQELKILTMLCSGLEREAIAKELNITTGTLKNHISSILNKMEFDSITKLLVYCVKNGYIIPSEEQWKNYWNNEMHPLG